MFKLLEADARGIDLPRRSELRSGPPDPSPEPGPPGLTRREFTLIEQLRLEANSEKDIFGWHAFQALSISSVALGGILYLMFAKDGGAPVVGLAAGAILVFALMTCQLGDSAYSSANRHYGYELFLYRVRTIDPDAAGRWRAEYRDIEWEAAMRAWRVVQTTLFETVYRPGRYFRRDKLRRDLDPARRPLWFSQASLSRASNARPYAGSYLARMHLMLLLVAGAADMLLLITVPALAMHPLPILKDFNDVIVLAAGAAFIFGTIALVARWRAERARRSIMEDGLLSIHSCAIVWQAVVLAHFCALKRARECGMTSWNLVETASKARAKQHKSWKLWRSGHMRFEQLVELTHGRCSSESKVDGAGLTGYTFWLAEEAASLARCACDVPGWIGLGEETLRARGIVK